ncbi:MAG: antibiotic biosynthesis monooxygenase [Verrucomicrobium sp.]|nr:antibiotic biosynthesis monooxygenase [Verrucomicrobium sp.]
MSSAIPATLVCTLKARPGAGVPRAVSSWQIRYHTKVLRFEGFMSADLLPPPHQGSHEWKLVVRFSTSEQLDQWMQSEERSWLTAEARELLADGSTFVESIPQQEDHARPGGVTEIIRSEVRPGMNDVYRDWTRKTQEAQARFDGFRGVHVIPPNPGQAGNEWTTLLRFDTEENLERWRQSSERGALLEEAKDAVQNTKATRLQSPFPGWVPVDPTTGASPAKWKTALLVLIGLYPLVMINLKYVRPFFAGWDVAMVTLALNVITVAATTYVTMPFLVARFGWWLVEVASGSAESANTDFKRGTINFGSKATRKGLSVIIAILIAEAGLFWMISG